jgi:hypothetical protein
MQVGANQNRLSGLQHGFVSGGSRQKQISYMCMALNRSSYDAPLRFVDLSKARNICSYFLGTLGQGMGLKNFLYQILLGSELLIRLRKEPITVSYSGLMTDAISALLVLGALWMENVTINGPSVPSARESARSYVFVANKNQRHAEALIRFGEALNWPFMDEARNCLETVYRDMVAGRLAWNADMWDWLFGLNLPGRAFRHKIMAALVYASPSARDLKSAPYYDNGLVIKNRSYWPKRTVLGRVLGARRDVKTVCGWIGPFPAPVEKVSGWIRLSARLPDIPVPIAASSQSALEDLGFAEPEISDAYTVLESILDPTEWIEAVAPARSANDASQSKLKAIHLTELPRNNTLQSLLGLPPEQYRASLDFEVNGHAVTYTLYANPIFVAAPPCVGSHVMHRRQAQKLLRNVVKVPDLKESYPRTDELVIIDALGQGEEVVARAWCAERGRHAIVKRGGDCCFSCAAAIAVGRTGLGCNVLILSQ